MTNEEKYREWETLVDSVVVEEFDQYESKILSQSAFSICSTASPVGTAAGTAETGGDTGARQATRGGRD